MPTARSTFGALFLFTWLLGLPLFGCDQDCEDDDDGGGHTSTPPASGSGPGASTTGTDTGSSQGRNVRICEARLVCEDGTLFESSASLCLTAAETAEELAFAREACIEDMTLECDGIGDGTSLECSPSCSAAMEPCECEDPNMGCLL